MNYCRWLKQHPISILIEISTRVDITNTKGDSLFFLRYSNKLSQCFMYKYSFLFSHRNSCLSNLFQIPPILSFILLRIRSICLEENGELNKVGFEFLYLRIFRTKKSVSYTEHNDDDDGRISRILSSLIR